jgi:hypothetical protein
MHKTVWSWTSRRRPTWHLIIIFVVVKLQGNVSLVHHLWKCRGFQGFPSPSQLFGSPAPSLSCSLSFPHCHTLGNVRQRDFVVSHAVLTVMLIASDSEHTYIYILLIKTNSMIYMCYIICKGGLEISDFSNQLYPQNLSSNGHRGLPHVWLGRSCTLFITSPFHHHVRDRRAHFHRY